MFGKKFASIAIGLSLGISLFTPPAMAGRYVLNQTPETIERHFGRYWTKLTTKDASGATRIRYTYSPAGLRRAFPQYSEIEFSIVFVNNRATSIYMDLSESKNVDDFTYEPADAAKFFNYIFGYQPPTWVQLSHESTGIDTVYNIEACLGDGVATDFTRMGAAQFVLGANLHYDPRCERF